MDAPSERILVCLRYGIGDVVMEMPALRGLRAQHPHAHLTALGAWPALELIEGDPLFDALSGVQDFGFRHWGDHGAEAARTSVAAWVDHNRFDRVLDAAHTVIGIRDVLGAMGIPVFNIGGFLDAATGTDGGGARSIWRSAVRDWGLNDDATEPLPRLHLPERARRAAHELFLHRGLVGREVVAIAPVASSRLKRWPMDRVCALMRRLANERECQLLVLGIPTEERSALERMKLAAGPDRVIHVAPRHLQETAALIQRCSALLSNDTGVMHIGAAVGTPSVAVFGPTSPEVVLPAGARAAGPEIPCGYRLNDRFGPPDCVLRDRCLIAPESCIAAVPVETVAQALYALLADPVRTNRSGAVP